jgi:hypothetical protein
VDRKAVETKFMNMSYLANVTYNRPVKKVTSDSLRK